MKTIFTKKKNVNINEGENSKKDDYIEIIRTKNTATTPVSDTTPLHLNENILFPLLDFIDVGIFVIDKQGDFIAVNNACCSIYGYKKNELIGKNIKILTKNKKLAQIINNVFINPSPIFFTWQSLHKNGDIINVTTSTSVHLHNNGINYSITTIKNFGYNKNLIKENNIVKNKHSSTPQDDMQVNELPIFEDKTVHISSYEKSYHANKGEELLDLAEKITHLGIIEIDYLSNKTYWSDGCFNLFGLFTNQTEVSKKGFEQFIHPGDKELFLVSFSNSIKNKLPFNYFETRIIRNDGMEVIISVNNYFTFNDQGRPLRLVAILQDITDQKKAAVNIKQSQVLLSTAEKIAAFGSAEYNIETKESVWSDGFYKILGATPDQIKMSPKAFLQFVHPDDRKVYLEWAKNNSFINDQPVEIRLIRLNGEVRNVLVFGITFYNEHGTAEKIVGAVQDITDRKKIDKELKDSNEKFKSLFYENPSGAFTLDLEGNITSANHIFTSKAECTEEELLKLNYKGFIHPDDLAKTFENIENAKKGDSQQLQIRGYTLKGNLLTIIIYCLPIVIDKKITGIFCISLDVTQAKNAEIELNKELNDRKSILDFSEEFICELDKEGKFLHASKAVKDFLGFTQSEIIGKSFGNLLLDKKDMPAIDIFSNQNSNNNEIITINNYLTKNKSVVNLAWNMRWDENNETTYCTVHETQKNKRYPQVLDLSEQHNRYLFYSNPQSLFLIDFLSLKIVKVNETALNTYNYTLNEFISLHLNDFISTDSTLFQELINDENYYTFFNKNIWTHIKKNGDKVYLNLKGNIVNYKGRRCILTLIDDITEKINAEHAIKISEDIRRLIMNAALDAIICVDINEKINFWNPQAEKIFGWKEADMLGKNLPDIILPERYRSIHNEVIQTYLKTGECPMLNILLHVTALKKDQEEFPIELTIIPIKESTEEFFCLYIRDITEQRKAETQKEFERRDKEALINNTDNLIWSVNKENKLIAGNTSFIEAFKFFTGKTLKSGDNLQQENIVFTEANILWKDLYSKALAGKSFKTEIKIPNKNSDAITYYEINLNPIYKNEEITGVACYGNDITEDKLNHNNLIIINTKLKTAQQIASLGYWEVNLSNNQIFLSDELYNIFGIEKETPTLSIETMFDLIHPDDRKLTIKNYFLTVDGRQPFNHEHRIILKDGTIKVVVQKGTILYNEKGKPITLEGTAQDITYRKNAEKLVKDSEEKYRMIFNSNPSANWIYDLETLNILEVNNAAVAHYGYSMPEFLKMSIDDIFVQNEMAEIIEINKEISSYGIMKFGQWHHIKKSGEIINVDITGHAIFYNGKNAVMVVSNDITEILHTQLELAKSIERFEYATKATSDAIWDCDLVNNTMFWGEGFNILFGYKLKEREPGISSLGEFCHPDDKEKILKSIQEVIINKEKIHWQEEYRFKKFDGTYVTVSDRALVVRDSEGNPYRIIGAMHDVTERIQNEKILKQLNGSLNKRAIDLARSNEELEQFAYITSHDLQEPLRMVSSFLTQIQKKYDPLLDETGRLYIRFAVDGAVRMRKLILDLLEYSRVGRQLYQFEKINTTDLLNEVTSIYTQIIAEKKLIIIFKNLPEIFAARSPLEQLFQNLISNAIKYQQPDSIPKIIITSVEKDDHWLFSVQDNGIGIDHEYFKKIFVIFQRLHNKDEYSGTGIGLAICKKIVDNHNGTIWVESTGKGSTFYFTISKLIAIQ